MGELGVGNGECGAQPAPYFPLPIPYSLKQRNFRYCDIAPKANIILVKVLNDNGENLESSLRFALSRIYDFCTLSDDVELCLRLNLRGLQGWYAPDAKAGHRFSATTGAARTSRRMTSESTAGAG